MRNKSLFCVTMCAIILVSVYSISESRAENNTSRLAPTAVTGTNSKDHAARANIVLLTTEEARKILQAWLNDHPFKPPAVLAPEHEEYSDSSGEYYQFSLADNQRYWLNFLVHKIKKQANCYT